MDLSAAIPAMASANDGSSSVGESNAFLEENECFRSSIVNFRWDEGTLDAVVSGGIP